MHGLKWPIVQRALASLHKAVALVPAGLALEKNLHQYRAMALGMTMGGAAVVGGGKCIGGSGRVPSP